MGRNPAASGGLKSHSRVRKSTSKRVETQRDRCRTLPKSTGPIVRTREVWESLSATVSL